MMKIIPSAVFLLLLFPFDVFGQHSLKVKVVDVVDASPLPGANVVQTANNQGNSTDKNGVVEFTNLPAGSLSIKISFVGYRDSTVLVTIPYREPELLIQLHPEEEELEDIIVSSTRTNRRIEDLPLKVEVLGLEEMDEESALVPGNVASILGDLAVITVQRTNPVNGNDAIRMQGLDPQYTLIAKDGLPLYGGFSGSLGVLSIPPLDLKQIEIIKGSVSTLYGGGAIAGMINFISKEPSEKPVQTLLFNVSTLKERNLNTYFSGKISPKIGYTLVAGANIKSAVDVNNDGYSEVPEHQSYIIHPRFFFKFNDQTKLNVGITTTIDNRRTGDMTAVEGEATPQHPYLRTEKSLRNVLDIQFNHNFSENHVMSFKTAISAFDRELTVPVRFVPKFSFKGTQYSSYSEINDRRQLGKHTLVVGGNLITESLRKSPTDSVGFSDYDYVTVGLFVQDDWEITNKFTIETGFRYDHHNINGAFPIPRIALFYKANDALSVRLASGAGYKAPNVLSLVDPTATLINNGAIIKSEYSTGVNADINYNTTWFDHVEVSLNQAFYFAEIKNPIRVITDTLARVSYMENQNFTTKTFGSDTYVQATYNRWELYLGYNHTEAYQEYASLNNPMPFNPKDKFSTTLAYAVEGKWRTGIEGSYMANQFIYNNQYYYNSQTIYPSESVPNFWFWAAMIERKLGFGSIVINVENLFDARQAKYGKLVEGSATLPTFRPIWGPLDGRVFNLSVKVNL
ncbi:MAG TPA: TonB-dependent receptor [Cyclobacteriaceae bacterium]|nr:TonB-dependent receptor [Cyclobacteriaceae bacterium]